MMTSLVKLAGITGLAFLLFTGCERSRDNAVAPELDQALKAEAALCFPDAAVIHTAPGYADLAGVDGVRVGSLIYSADEAEMAQGFRGPVPAVVICDADGRVLHTALLPNREDKTYLARLERRGLMSEWSGFSTSEAAELPVDTVTGATYSSRAAIESVQTLLLKRKSNQ